MCQSLGALGVLGYENTHSIKPIIKIKISRLGNYNGPTKGEI